MKDGKLEAKDLMIGDWVYFGKNACEKEKTILDLTKPNPAITEYHNVPTRVIGVSEITIDIKKDTYRIAKLPLEYAEPIPLTPEILEKNGFSDRGKAGWQNPYYDITYYWELNTFTHNVYKQEHIDMIHNVQYVHELQRALRCCGLWGLVENFVV